MNLLKTIATLFLITALTLLGVPEARAIRPLSGNFAVVAGSQYTSGFKDGNFSTALFSKPLGLSVSGDGNQLFVADSGNNCVRVIHLDQNNEVSTLAGQLTGGNLDGPAVSAQFRDPRGVLYLPGNYLVVNDFGNQSIRFVDMNAGKVTTYNGGPVHLDGSDSPNPDAKPVLLAGIKDMAYLASANSLFFTQPDAGVLNVLNFETGKIAAVMKDNALLPHPFALWIQEDKIYMADRDVKNIASMDWKNDAVANIAQAGAPADKVLSLSSSDGVLYSVLAQQGAPAQRFFLDPKWGSVGNANTGMVKFMNAWGDIIPPDKLYGQFMYGEVAPSSPWAAWIPDPSSKRRFFYSIPDLNIIVSVRDLFGEGNNTHGVFGPEYPVEKPKNTYRIMMVGDCRTTECDRFPFPSESHPTSVFSYSQALGLTPQIEHELNFQAALDNNPINYEVLNFGHHGDLIFWPSIDVPAAAKLYDVDLLIVFGPNLDRNAYDYYFTHNLTEDGIPMYPPDMEYFLKPPLERIPDGLPREFYDYCKAHNMVKLKGRNLEFDNSVNTDPKLQDMVMEFWGKPWVVLNRKLNAMTTSFGKPRKMVVILTYTGPQSASWYRPDFYKSVAQKFNIPYFDLNPDMNALHMSYYPVTAEGSHLNPDGCKYFGKLLAHELREQHLIPWPTPVPEKAAAKKTGNRKKARLEDAEKN